MNSSDNTYINTNNKISNINNSKIGNGSNGNIRHKLLEDDDVESTSLCDKNKCLWIEGGNDSKIK